MQTSNKRPSGLDEIAVKMKVNHVPKKKRVFEAHVAHLATQNIADKPLVACLDSENVMNTQEG